MIVSGYPESVTYTDYLLEVARGKVSGAQPFSGYGQITTSGADSGILWPDSALYIPTTGVQPSLVSTSANDTSAGTGIRTVKVEYLDTNYDPHTETVTMNGTTPVTMTACTVKFINNIIALTVGSNGASVGTITASYSGNNMSVIGVGQNNAQSSARMIPNGKVAFITGMAAGSSSGSAAASTKVTINSTQAGTTIYTHYFALGEIVVQDGSATLSMTMPLGPFMEGAVIAMAYETDKTATIAGTWFGWIENASTA